MPGTGKEIRGPKNDRNVERNPRQQQQRSSEEDDALRFQQTLGNAELQRQQEQERLLAERGALPDVELERLRAVAEILRYEDEHGTWNTITNYNAITGDIPGRNVWVRTSQGFVADLCWMFDVAVVAGGVSGTASGILGSFGGRLGEFVGAVLGQSAGGLAYMGGRFVGASAEGVSNGSWDSFTRYLEG